MATELDVATLVRNRAIARREKRDSRMPAATLLAHIAALLNSEDKMHSNMENQWRGKTKPTQIVNRYTTVIRENGLDDLVGVDFFDADYGVCLVKFEAALADDDENDDADDDPTS